jgi:DNA-binding response OmpR family regulator
LRYEGFRVEVAGSGRGALTAATSFRPHLIVLDVMLPDLDGFEVQRRLAADRLRVPILWSSEHPVLGEHARLDVVVDVTVKEPDAGVVGNHVGNDHRSR